MPLTPPRGATSPRRRSLLAAALGTLGGAGLAAGCSADGDTTGAGRDDADDTRALRKAAARDSEALLARYEGTTAAHPALAERLRPLRGETARHLDALREDVRSRPGRGDARKPPGPRVPSGEAEALAALADAERRISDSRLRALTGAPPELARLLASVAAAGAAHVYLLTEGAG